MASPLTIAEYLGRPWVIVFFIVVMCTFLSHQITKLAGSISRLQHAAQLQGAESKILLARNIAELDSLTLSEQDRGKIKEMLFLQHRLDDDFIVSETLSENSSEQYKSVTVKNLIALGVCGLSSVCVLSGNMLFYWKAGYKLSLNDGSIQALKLFPDGGETVTWIAPSSYFIGGLMLFVTFQTILFFFPLVRRYQAALLGGIFIADAYFGMTSWLGD